MMHGLPCGRGKSRLLALTKPKDTEFGVLIELAKYSLQFL